MKKSAIERIGRTASLLAPLPVGARGPPLKSPLGQGGTTGGWLPPSPLLGERVPEGWVRGAFEFLHSPRLPMVPLIKNGDSMAMIPEG